MRDLVLVTEGSGYIAGFCIACLLREGWRVRASVKSVVESNRARAHLDKIGVEAAAVEFVEADVNCDHGWDRAVADADYVFHASVPNSKVDPNGVGEPVQTRRDAALRVLKAARDAGVKRAVVTSSISAIIYGRRARESPFSETDWTDETNRADSSPRCRGATIVEREIWAWHGAEGGALELVTVNPGLVIGPVPGPDFLSSVGLIKDLLDGKTPALFHFGYSLVDVRDIAQLHVLAMTTPAAAGQRFIGAGDFFWIKDIARILRNGLGEKARSVPSLDFPDFLVRVLAVFNPVARSRLCDLGNERKVSSEKAWRTLGWKARPASESILDAARSLHTMGLV